MWQVILKRNPKVNPYPRDYFPHKMHYYVDACELARKLTAWGGEAKVERVDPKASAKVAAPSSNPVSSSLLLRAAECDRMASNAEGYAKRCRTQTQQRYEEGRAAGIREVAAMLRAAALEANGGTKP